MSLKDKIVNQRKFTFNDHYGIGIIDGEFSINGSYWKLNENEKNDVCTRRNIRRLIEAFHLPDVEFVEQMIDECYENPEQTYEIFEKYGIELHFDNEQFDTVLAGYDYLYTKKLKVTLGMHVDDWIEKGQQKNLLIKEIESAIVHENTHQQQDQKGFTEYNKNNYISGQEDYIKHYSQKTEIIAWARQFAFEIYCYHNKDKEKSLKAIRDNDYTGILKGNKPVFDIYKEIGDKVYKKLKHEIYKFFVEE